MDSGTVPVVVLAAGGSTRFGGPKQKLEFGGKSLLRHAVETASASSCDPVYVVLGSNTLEFSLELSGLRVVVVINPDWETGMASSIRAGLEAALSAETDPGAVLLMAVDQPLVTSSILDSLLEAYRRAGPGVVACSYEDTVGIPALFDRALFGSLESLEGDRGAKSIIELNRDGAVLVDCPEAAFDIDTAEDLDRLPGM